MSRVLMTEGHDVVDAKKKAIADVIDKNEKDLWEAASAVLSFYGSEATSHGGIAVGFFLAFFALLQVRKGLDPIGVGVTMYVVLLGIVFSGLRVIYYGTLSALITASYVVTFEEFLNVAGKNKRSPHAFIHEFCRWGLTTKFRIRGALFKRPLYHYVATFVVSFVILGGLVFLGLG